MASNQEQFVIKAEVRQGRGKNDTRRLRAAGKVPMTVYGGEGEAVSIVAQLSEVAAVLRSERGATSLFKIDVEGAGETEVMFADRQIHPLKGRLMHADLRRIVRGQKVDVTIPIHIEGEAVGMLEDGGNLETVLHELHIRCRPSQIPDAIHADVSKLRVRESLHVSDLIMDEGVEVLSDPSLVVATVTYVSDADFAESLTSQVEAGEPEVEEKGGDEEE